MADLTAVPLLLMFRGLVAESKELSVDEQKICDAVFKRTTRLIETRNVIVQATWFVGCAGSKSDDVSQVAGFKQRRGKSGSDIQHFAKDAEGFRTHAQECELVAEILMRLYGCILMNRDIDKNFIIERGQVAVQ